VCQGIAGPRRKRELNDALPDRSQLKITVVNVYTSNRFPMLSVLYGGAVRRYGGGECVLVNHKQHHPTTSRRMRIPGIATRNMYLYNSIAKRLCVCTEYGRPPVPSTEVVNSENL
jgi:hypothetical protein